MREQNMESIQENRKNSHIEIDDVQTLNYLSNFNSTQTLNKKLSNSLKQIFVKVERKENMYSGEKGFFEKRKKVLD